MTIAGRSGSWAISGGGHGWGVNLTCWEVTSADGWSFVRDRGPRREPAPAPVFVHTRGKDVKVTRAVRGCFPIRNWPHTRSGDSPNTLLGFTIPSLFWAWFRPHTMYDLQTHSNDARGCFQNTIDRTLERVSLARDLNLEQR